MVATNTVVALPSPLREGDIVRRKVGNPVVGRVQAILQPGWRSQRAKVRWDTPGKGTTSTIDLSSLELVERPKARQAA